MCTCLALTLHPLAASGLPTKFWKVAKALFYVHVRNLLRRLSTASLDERTPWTSPQRPAKPPPQAVFMDGVWATVYAQWKLFVTLLMTVALAHVASTSSIAIVSPDRQGAVLPFANTYVAVAVEMSSYGGFSAREPSAVGAWLSTHFGAIVITSGQAHGSLEAMWCGDEPGLVEGPLSLQTDGERLHPSPEANERLKVGGYATVSSDRRAIRWSDGSDWTAISPHGAFCAWVAGLSDDVATSGPILVPLRAEAWLEVSRWGQAVSDGDEPRELTAGGRKRFGMGAALPLHVGEYTIEACFIAATGGEPKSEITTFSVKQPEPLAELLKQFRDDNSNRSALMDLAIELYSHNLPRDSQSVLNYLQTLDAAKIGFTWPPKAPEAQLLSVEALDQRFTAADACRRRPADPPGIAKGHDTFPLLSQITPTELADARSFVSRIAKAVDGPTHDQAMVLENVCMIATRHPALAHALYKPNGTLAFAWLGMKGAGGEFARVSRMFFGHMGIVEAHVRGEGALKVKYVRGRTLLSSSGNTVSHFSEIWFKDNWDAAMLGGRRDRVLFFEEDGFVLTRSSRALLAIAFESAGSQIPPLYWLGESRNVFPHSDLSMPICFEELQVRRLTHLNFRSEAEADRVRSAGWRYCRLREPGKPRAPRPVVLKVVFTERSANRFIINAEDLCRRTAAVKGLSALVHTESSRMELCEDMVVYHAADVIVSNTGSHNTLQVFARAGSVVISVFPFNDYYPRWKIPNRHACLRQLEIVGIVREHTMVEGTFANLRVNVGVLDPKYQLRESCGADHHCRVYWRYSSVYVDPVRFGRYLEVAAQRWGNVSAFEPCERVRLGMRAADPLNPQVPYNYCEQAYEVCEAVGGECSGSIACAHDLRALASACLQDTALNGM